MGPVFLELLRAKGNDDFRPCWYRQLRPDTRTPMPGPPAGPFRDRTDAENHALDRFKVEPVWYD